MRADSDRLLAIAPALEAAGVEPLSEGEIADEEWRGTPCRLLEAIRQRDEVRLFSSPALLEELAEVLDRASPTKRLAVIGRSAREVLADCIAAIEIALPLEVPRVVPADPNDDHVIAAAVAAHATLTV